MPIKHIIYSKMSHSIPTSPTNPPTLEQLEKQYAMWENKESPDKTEFWLNWSVFEICSKKLVGRVQVGINKDTREASVAYVIEAHHKGKASEQKP